MRHVSGLSMGLALYYATAAHAWADPETCADLKPSPAATNVASRFLEPRDLVGLRDIGPNITFDARLAVLSVSPDGQNVAFQLRRAEPDTNSYCLGMFVVSTHPGGRITPVDAGGEFMRPIQNFQGVTNYLSGYTDLITPKWSPDGRSIAYLRRDHGVTQVWQAMADGSGAHAVTHTPFDIETFDWMPDGMALRLSGRPTLADAVSEIDREAKNGYLFDERFVPLVASRPFPRDSIPVVQYRVRLSDGELTPVVSDETRKSRSSVIPDDAVLVAEQGQSSAWTRSVDAGSVTVPRKLQVKMAGAAVQTCQVTDCDGVVDLWWSADADTLFYMRREGWRLSRMGLYAWRPKAGEPKPLLVTDDAFVGCQKAQMRLICTVEGSTQPRRLVAIDLETGLVDELFDPNPEFANIKLGTVKRLYWKNDRGLEAFGDLVLPPDHQPGQHHPLIVIQYDSRGFLRGGTDDEYPIQLFAARGFAVLSFHHPRTVGASAGAKTWEEVNRLNHDDWADRKSIQSALEVGLKMAIDTGAVDPDRMGITGVSDGSNMLQFALINSDLFQAAASSSCCEDPGTLLSLSGINGAQMMTAMGYPRLTDDGEAYWRPYSLRMNAGRINTPLLMQLADTEYMAGLETFTSLREAGSPVEMFVYPDEYHEKWQPSHRYAVYARNVDWFAFWLMGQEDSDPAKVAQYKRWRDMRRPIPLPLSTASGKQ